MSKVEQLMNLQDAMNAVAAGKAWMDGVTEEGRVINWPRAINLELAELVESLNWKWWKSIDAESDIANARIEAVDVMHFVLSYNMEIMNNTDCLVSGDSVKEASSIMEDALAITNSVFNSKEKKVYDAESIAIAAEKLQRIAMTSKPTIIGDPDIGGPSRFLLLLNRTMFELALTLGMDFDDIFELYVQKNVLNMFRQANGYKSGTYIKIWKIKGEEQEDNVWLVRAADEIKASTEDISYDLLYAKLTEKYTENDFIAGV